MLSSTMKIIREGFGNLERSRVSSLEPMATFGGLEVANVLVSSRDPFNDYLLEIRVSEETPSPNPRVDADSHITTQLDNLNGTNSTTIAPGTPRPKRHAFRQAQDMIKTWVNDLNK